MKKARAAVAEALCARVSVPYAGWSGPPSTHAHRSCAASYRGLSAADEAEAPVPRALGGLGAADAEPPRFNACGAFYRGMSDMEPSAPQVFPVPMLKRENARQ